jgi:hypothetical protein
VNGKAAVVIREAESYEALVEVQERADNVKILKERLEYVRKGGRLLTVDDIFESISEKYGISFD